MDFFSFMEVKISFEGKILEINTKNADVKKTSPPVPFGSRRLCYTYNIACSSQKFDVASRVLGLASHQSHWIEVLQKSEKEQFELLDTSSNSKRSWRALVGFSE